MIFSILLFNVFNEPTIITTTSGLLQLKASSHHLYENLYVSR